MLFFVAQLSSSIGCKLQVRQFESTESLVVSFGGDISENFAGRCGMTTDTVNTVFANFDSGCRHFHESLEESTDRRIVARCPQQTVPFFMSFPVVAVVKQIDRQQLAAVFLP